MEKIRSRVGNVYLAEVHTAGHASSTATHHGVASHGAFLVVSLDGNTLLLILIDPFGEISLDEGVSDLVLGEAGPVLCLAFLFAKGAGESSCCELVC